MPNSAFAAPAPTEKPPASGLLGTKLPLPGGLEMSFGQAALVAGIVFYALAIPGDLNYKLDGMGFGVCHQIHTHSFTIGGHQMPLCARCTGIYLGTLATVLLLAVLRRRAIRLPSRQVAPLLLLFFGVMLADGVNSTAQTFGAGLWETTNLTRLATGVLSGVAVAFLFYPAFNLSMWSREAARRERVIEQPYELAAYLLAGGVLAALVLDGGGWLYYPLAILSAGGMLLMLTMANTMLVMMLTRREERARTAGDALTPVLAGVLVSLVMLTLLAWGRASLAPALAETARTLGMPLVPGLP